MLFARGRVELLQTVMLGVVGTRRPTPYGIAVAERLSADLAHAGLTIVSGMARGIDTAAHKGRSHAGGDTVAVLGCGVDVVYPAENRKLAADIAAKGLIVSEFPMGATAYPAELPDPQSHHQRHERGHSGGGGRAVQRLGHHGPKLAMDQGREVFAVPGNITSKMSWGPNLLIKQGAKLVQEWNDVVVELPPEARRQLIEKGQRQLLAAMNLWRLRLHPHGLGQKPIRLRRSCRQELSGRCRWTSPYIWMICLEKLQYSSLIRADCRTF